MRLTTFLSILLLALPLSAAHSWVERLRRLDLNGTMVGDAGFIRAAMSQLDPAFSDLTQQYLLPPTDRDATQGLSYSDRICRDTQQKVGFFNESFPLLQAQPGDFIALQYQENGHVTLTEVTPHKANQSSVFIYGTEHPSEDDRLLSIHHVWNSDGSGGDKRGSLLAVRAFDDGRCYQINDGPSSTARQAMYKKDPVDPQGADLWCQNDIRLPFNIHSNYTIYWVWEWPSLPTPAFPLGRKEVYTSCMDLQMLPGVQNGEVSYVWDQDLNLAGIEEQMHAGQAS